MAAGGAAAAAMALAVLVLAGQALAGPQTTFNGHTYEVSQGPRASQKLRRRKEKKKRKRERKKERECEGGRNSTWAWMG